MKGMLKRILDLKTLWKISKLDFATWIVAALGTLFLDVVSADRSTALVGESSVNLCESIEF